VEAAMWLSRLLVVLIVFALSCPAEAQQAKKVPRIAYVDSSGTPAKQSASFEAFEAGLLDLRYIDGQNIIIERGYAEGRLDKVPSLVNELIQRKPEIFVAFNNVAIGAAQRATKEIPIVIASSLDPVAAGYVESLAHPGANITGIASLNRDLSAKRVELLKELFPRLSRLAVLWDVDGPGPKVAFKEYEAASRAYKLNLQSLGVHGPSPDLESVFQKAVHADAVIIVSNPLIRANQKKIMELVNRNRIPSMTENFEYLTPGGLVSYGADIGYLFKRPAYYVDKILKGARPADLPVEQPTKYELVINLKTAKQIGVTIPQPVLYRADKVIK